MRPINVVAREIKGIDRAGIGTFPGESARELSRILLGVEGNARAGRAGVEGGSWRAVAPNSRGAHNESLERPKTPAGSRRLSERKSDWLMNIKFGPQLLSAL